MTLKLRPLLSVLFVALLAALAGCEGDTPINARPGLPYTPDKPKEADPVVLMKTDKGEIKLQLFEDAAPNTVANFISLVEKGFYNGLTFHRVVHNFMIQGGDPKGDGTGGPGYRFKDEVVGNPYQKMSTYQLCMANSGPDTNGSQFFIITSQYPRSELKDKHTVFGTVVKGFDTAHRIENVEVVAPPTGGSKERPKDPIHITSVSVVSKRGHPYEVKDKLPEAAQPQTSTATQQGKTINVAPNTTLTPDMLKNMQKDGGPITIKSQPVAEEKPAETPKAPETKPAEAVKPAEAKPTETKPVETKPAETK